MKIRIADFKGMAPRIAPRELPDNMAQNAVNSRILSGDLEAYNNYGLYKTLLQDISKEPPYSTIYRMDGQYWLYWTVAELSAAAFKVDVARGFVPSDTTERTYFTGTDVPRVTNLDPTTPDACAICEGTELYPEHSIKLGVPAPTEIPLVDGTDGGADEGDDLGSWNVVVDAPVPDTRNIAEDASFGNPLPSYQFDIDDYDASPTGAIHMDKDFSVGTKRITTTTFDVYFPASPAGGPIDVLIGCDASGGGSRFTIGTSNVVTHNQFSGFGTDYGAPNTYDYSETIDYDKWVTVTLKSDLGNDDIPSTTIKITVDGVDILSGPGVKLSAIAPFDGTHIGFIYRGINLGFPLSFRTFIDNISVSLADSEISDDSQELTNYVVTYVNEFGEEGPPSDPSNNVTRPIDGSVPSTITTTTTAPDEYGIVKKRLYRAVTGSTGTDYQFVAEIPLEQADFVDSLLDEELGEVLSTLNYDLPPTDMRGILALPNGIMMGFSKNDICPSVQFKPYAYPVDYRLSTDYPVVGISNIDTTVIVATEAYPYLVVGSDPAGLSMAKLEVPYGCASKDSMVTIKGYGVLYASQEGLVAINGANAEIVTKKYFTPREWRELAPETMHAVSHEDRYFCWYWIDEEHNGGFIFDPLSENAGLVKLDFYAVDAWVDRRFACLFMLIDENVYCWERGATKRPYIWKSKLFQTPYPTNLSNFQVKARDYDDLTLKLYGDGNLILTKTITSLMEFVGPPDVVNEFEVQLEGTSRVTQIEVSDGMEELA